MIDSFNRISVHISFQIFLLFTQLNCLYGAVTQSPSGACEGESITVSCVLTLLNAGDEFDSRRTNFIIGDSNNSITETLVDGTGTVNGIDLSRFMADDPLGSNTNVTGSITLLSYQTSDENLRMGCGNDFTPSGGGSSVPFILTLRLNQALPPSSPSLSTSLSTLSASECQGVSVSWLAPATDRALTQYYLYRDSSLISTLSNTTTQYTDTDSLTLNAAYLYSLAAASCAGNSTLGSATAVVTGYDLMMTASPPSLNYDNVTSMITLNWDFSAPTPTTTLLIEYSLTLNYSHTQGNVTRTFSNSTSFSLLSSDARTSTQSLTPHSFVGGLEVETNITAVLRITQQCGQSYSGTQISCSISSMYLPPPDTSVQTPTPSLSSSIPPPSSTYISPTPTPTPTPVIPSPDPLNTGGYSSLIIGISIIGLLCLVALVVIALLVVIIIFLLLKVKQLNSIIIASKPAPSHPYEYIDLDKMSDNISSPTQQQSPQDYVPMSSVHKQDTTQPPTHYANLK